MIITILWVALLLILLVAGSVASYLRLLTRRLTPVGARKVFPAREGGRFQPDRERVGVSISALHGAAMHLFAVGLTGLLVLRRPEHFWENLGLALLLVLCAVAIFDQLIPFLLVARHDEPEAILRGWMPFFGVVIYAALPLTFPILISTTIARLLEPVEAKPEESNPQEDLQELIQAGEDEGIIKQGEGELLQSLLEFGEKQVREVMTPRPEIAALEINRPIEDLRRLFREKRLTRYPVYSGVLDNIEGIVSVRDLMQLPLDEQVWVSLRSLVRPVTFVPETKPIRELLKELQDSTTQMAIVVDEYGAVAGLVTIEDLVEEIVGEIRDEVEPHAGDVSPEPGGTYLVAGHTELAEIADRFQVELQKGDYSTVAGLILARLGHVPKPGEKVAANGLTFEVVEANQRTVLKIRLQTAVRSSPPGHA